MDPLLPAGAPPLCDWHPKVRRLFEYWNTRRPDPDLLPGRQHFEPLDVVDLLPHLWIVEHDKAAGRLRYRLVGTRIVEAIGRDVTGRWFDEVHPEAAQRAGYLRAVAGLRAGVPIWRRGRPWYRVDPEIFEAERMLLPLARDGRQVDMTLAITIFFFKGGAEAFP